ncbi:MAG TPA: PEP-utilizing enzyme [Ilumatobacter sp.]
MEHPWTPPGPGPWQQDSAHNPVAQTLIMQALYPSGFKRGFEETFANYGMLLDRLALAIVNGFVYHQPQPFDMPGPDGPPSPEQIGAEIGRRTGVAAAAFEQKIWRAALARWDDELKPASIARHRRLGDVELAALDATELAAHVRACMDQIAEMGYQHHRHNLDAMVPVGDFVLRASALTGRSPVELLVSFEGCSPVSNVCAPEIEAAVAAVNADPGAGALFDLPAAEAMAALRERFGEVDDWVRNVHYRLMDGFDLPNPTIGEQPALLLGRLRAAMAADRSAVGRAGDAYVAAVRAEVPSEHHAEFDELLDEARLVYRLRDERGIFSDIAAIGLLRLALLEVGRRRVAAGAQHDVEDILDVSVAELDDILDGGTGPTADAVAARRAARVAATAAGPPRFLGDPPPPPPPVDQLPPPLARVMSAVGFLIDGVLGQLEEAAGDDRTIVGIPGNAGVYEGRAHLVRSIDDLLTMPDGAVLVAPTTGEAFNSMLHLVGAIVTDHGSFASHAAIVAREMGFPAVVGTNDGTRRIAQGDRVRVDGAAGQVTVL